MESGKTFSIAFPNVSELHVTIKEIGIGVKPNKSAKKFSHDTITKTIKCSNPACHNGGLKIARILWQMDSNRSTAFEGSVKCTGLEGTPQAKRKRLSCINSYHYKISIKYKDA